ncbi:ATP-grasp fold amidoligase family protein [Phytohalomonas tamaricis]|uniref:ATP-grasp fold amidoligase family protein n=1 Tax=Phytohalomonas tamaricis TaxID=2081032 RepID=UPI000D0AFE62|nr:ATP-grasp fold amidoligase family protein [Phytohalomonas tamaricis]
MPRVMRNNLGESYTTTSDLAMKSSAPNEMNGKIKNFYNAMMAAIRSNIMNSLSDRLHVPLRYKRAFGEFPNLKNPKTFNEKICYRKLHPQPIFSVLSDKIEAREYVAYKIGEQHLVPCYKIASSISPKLFAQLPNSFVMKANHGFGYNLLVHDKSQYTFPYLYNLSTEWLSHNFYKICRENHYKRIQPRLIFERLLLDENHQVPKDFKFHCFKKEGEDPVVFIEVAHDRFTNYKVDFYDQAWNLIDIREDKYSSGQAIAKPKMLDKGIELALKLAEGFSYVRVDFYIVEEHIYFGEMTFTPTAGLTRFKYKETDEEWGKLFDI